jgi:hypothetical protein
MGTRIYAAACAMMCATFSSGPAGQNRASPHETVSATIDDAAISITYGRPFMRGRRIIGVLVPYDRVWCPGADEATTLTTSRPLRIGELALASGSYTLWMLPTSDGWTLIVNTQTGQFHTQYNARYDLGRIRLVKRSLDTPVEQLTFAIEKKPGAAGGSIAMQWETTEVSAPFTVAQ